MRVRIEKIVDISGERFQRQTVGSYECDYKLFDDVIEPGERVWFGIDTDGGRKDVFVLCARLTVFERGDAREIGATIDVATEDVFKAINQWLDGKGKRGIRHRFDEDRMTPPDADEYVRWATEHKVWP